MNIQPPTPELEVEPTAITLAASFMSVVANAATCVVAIMFVLGLFEILPIRYCVYPAKVGAMMALFSTASLLTRNARQIHLKAVGDIVGFIMPLLVCGAIWVANVVR